jgi:hypothetical protein
MAGRLRRELSEPWGILVSGLIGGAAWAVGVAPVLAVGAGVATLAVKVAAGIAARNRPAETEVVDERALPVVKGSPEAGWVARAQQAQHAVSDVKRSCRPGPLLERLSTVDSETGSSLASLRRMAGQASAVGQAMVRIDGTRLGPERDRLKRAIAAEDDPRLRAEEQRSLAAVQSQIDSYTRLAQARETLLARLESGTLGLEGVVARLAEVVALAETSGLVPDTTGVDALTAELEGLRAGLVEAEAVTQQTLAPLDLAEPGSVAPDPPRLPGRRGTG